MFRLINSLTINKRLQAISIISISFICILIGLIFYTNRKAEQVKFNVEKSDAMTMGVWMRLRAYNAIRGDFLLIFISDPVTQKDYVEQATDLLNERFNDLEGYNEDLKYWDGALSYEVRRDYDSLNSGIEKYVAFCKRNLSAVREVNIRDTVNFIKTRKIVVEDFDRYYLDLREKALNILDTIYLETIRDEEQAQHEISNMMLLFYILSATLALTIFIIIRIIARSMLVPITETRTTLELLSKGQIPNIKDYNGKDELSGMLHSLKGFSLHMNKLMGFVSNVAKSNFQEEASMFEGKGPIAEALINMRDSLKNSALLEAQNNWTIQGLADLGNLIRQQEGLDKLYDQILAYIIKYLKANQGALYVVENNADQIHLKMNAVYAYARKKFITGSVRPGEGLVGQAYLERGMIILKEIPDDYIKIHSGLGGALPNHLIVSPLITNDKVYGVMEIASFKIFQPHQIDLISKFSEQIASAIAARQINTNTQKLLNELQQKTEAMKIQEDNMRENIEELFGTYGETQHSLTETQAREHFLQSLLDTVEQDIITVDNNYNVLHQKKYNRETLRKIFRNEIKSGENILPLLNDDLKSSIQEMLNNTFSQQEIGKLNNHNIQITTKPLYDQKRNITGAAIFIMEI
ncbi:MAG TPA: GAF domain-containing protein [Cyclobacteriaceae bacterium]|jgi:hypothetical protein|nr:GAF domain-containing protein [Cyclobacteriaceae bacterium]